MRKPTLALQCFQCSPTLPSSLNETHDSPSHKCFFTVRRQSASYKYVKWETYKALARSISKIDGHMKRGNGGAECHTGPQKLISIIVHIPVAPWAQVALTHYSNPYGLSFMDKGNYGLLLAHPHCGKEYSYGSGHVWETTKKWPENSMYFKENKYFTYSFSKRINLHFLIINNKSKTG